MRAALVVTAVVSAIGLAACGSSSSKSTSSNSPSASPSTSGASSSGASTGASSSAAPASTAAGAVTIKMVNIAFSPASTSVKVGQTVKWTNQDSVEHNVVATAGATFKSPNFGAGGSYSHKFTKAGKVSYVCTIHPNMKATLTVTK